MDDGNAASPLSRAIASYHKIIDNQLDSLSDLEAWLKERCLSLDPEARFKLQAQNGDVAEVEKFLTVLTTACNILAVTDSHTSRLGQLIKELQTTPVSGDPGKIVQSHIRLLGEYNEAKDIAQQLIGLVADNRGVPVGSLYKDDQYGVGPDD